MVTALFLASVKRSYDGPHDHLPDVVRSTYELSQWKTLFWHHPRTFLRADLNVLQLVYQLPSLRKKHQLPDPLNHYPDLARKLCNDLPPDPAPQSAAFAICHNCDLHRHLIHFASARSWDSFWVEGRKEEAMLGWESEWAEEGMSATLMRMLYWRQINGGAWPKDTRLCSVRVCMAKMNAPMHPCQSI